MHISVIISFNETLFEPEELMINISEFRAGSFIKFSNFSIRFGAGNYNATVAGELELRFQRIHDSIATGSEFSFVSPSYFTAYAESV